MHHANCIPGSEPSEDAAGCREPPCSKKPIRMGHIELYTSHA